ncbi:MAG: YhcH/YjgK/YiaL family protein [Oscillospiraceae bacterium]|nr:YhcH/YjgK/YiaL family protein [Oscillospiraceae bacterium]
MIMDTLPHLHRYTGIHPNLELALDWLSRQDLHKLPDGRHEILNTEVFVNIMTAQLRPAEAAEFEWHRQYADLQLELSGCEAWEYSREQAGERAFDPVRDIGFFKAEPDVLGTLAGQRFVIFFPGEAHKPACLPEAEAGASDTDPAAGPTVRKAVLKIRLS